MALDANHEMKGMAVEEASRRLDAPVICESTNALREQADEARDVLTPQVRRDLQPRRQPANPFQIFSFEQFENVVELYRDVVGRYDFDDAVTPRRLRHDERGGRTVFIGIVQSLLAAVIADRETTRLADHFPA